MTGEQGADSPPAAATLDVLTLPVAAVVVAGVGDVVCAAVADDSTAAGLVVAVDVAAAVDVEVVVVGLGDPAGDLPD